MVEFFGLLFFSTAFSVAQTVTTCTGDFYVSNYSLTTNCTTVFRFDSCNKSLV